MTPAGRSQHSTPGSAPSPFPDRFSPTLPATLRRRSVWHFASASHYRRIFRFPYAAIGFSDFWRRWHISLSSWLRDYLYIPLGGNRKGPVRTYINLALTMLLGGLWHGASWNFVVWGGLHGAYLAIERFLKARFGSSEATRSTIVKILLALLTYTAVNITWVFFRATDFETSSMMVMAMFGFVAEDAATPLPTLYIIQVVSVITLILLAHWKMRDTTLEATVQKIPRWLLTTMLVFMVFTVIITQGAGDAFIYFQF